jgi:MFS family permease
LTRQPPEPGSDREDGSGGTARPGTTTPGGVAQTPIRRALIALFGRALRHRNFRLFTFGQSVSLIGTWMQNVAVGWLVYRLTGSAFLLGLLGFVSQGPNFLLAPIAGVLADRFDKRRIVLITQSAMMVQAFVLAALVLTDRITITWVLVLMGVLGAATGFDIPGRQSFLVELVEDRDDLPNAIALNSSIFNAARLLGPAIAGLVVAAVGEGICILINAVSYAAVLIALLAIRVPRRQRARRTAVIQGLMEGVRYAYRLRPMRAILLLVAFVSLVAVPFTVLLPIIATGVLGGGAETLGFLMSASGLGALAGALYLASRTTVRGLGRLMTFAATAFGVGLIGTSLSRVLWLSLLCLALAGFGMMVQMASSNTVLQTLVDDDKRGRVMSLYSMAFIGVSPIGSLLLGTLAAMVSASAAFAVSGTACILAAIVFGAHVPSLRQTIRPIYVRLGIIPEVARGVQAVTHDVTPRANP